MEAHSGAPQALCSFLLLCLVSFQIIMCYQGSLRKMTALWRRRSESCDDPILKIWQGGDFKLCDAFYFCKKGIENIVEDQVTQRFTSEEMASWNLLTRTNNNFCYISVRLTIIWGLGVFIRYCVLLPLR